MGIRDKNGYVHCKYLDQLGIPLTKQNTNFCDKKDKRWKDWKKQQKEYGFDERETWNLDYMFVEWIYTRFRMFKEIGGETVDLTYHKFKYKDIEITQKEAIDYILIACDQYLTDDDVHNLPPEIYKLLEEIMPCMWW